MILNILLIIFGFIFLIKGADLLVKAAVSIAKRFGLSEMLIGLTILAIGTSLPEIFVTITSSVDEHSDLIIGNAIGSCICNFLLVIGVTSLIKPVKFDKRIIEKHFPISFISMVLLLVLGNIENSENVQTITNWHGIVLLLYMIWYILYSIYEEKKFHNKKIDEEIIKEVSAKENYSIKMIIVYIILGSLGLKFGSDFIVDNSVIIAKNLGLSESFIGMTIIAVGTALPEIITGIMSAKQNETDLLLGSVTGSNIINLCLLIGLSSLINPLKLTNNFNSSILFLMFVTITLQIIGIKNKENEIINKTGIVLIIVYLGYIISMLY